MALLILGGLATDLVEPEDPRRIATVPMGAEITRLAGRGRYLGVGTRDMDLRMFSLEDPTRPRLTHRLDTIGLAASLLFPDSLLYFVEHRLGLKVVEVSRSGTMGILSHLPVRNAAYLTLWRTRGFLVAEGVHILDHRNRGIPSWWIPCPCR